MRIILTCLLLMGLVTSRAALQIELTQGVNQSIPIAVVPFATSKLSLPTDVAQVIKQDLQNSGRFNLLDTDDMDQVPHQASAVNMSYWKNQSVDDVVVGSISADGKQYKVNVALVNLYNNNQTSNAVLPKSGVLFNESFIVPAKALRAIGHHIADQIYLQLTGEKGVFSTRLAYVVINSLDNGRKTYRLEVSDYDGYNPQTVLYSPHPIMSPAWSPDGKQLAYVSFETGKSAIYIDNLASGKRSIVADYAGVNGAPAWSPDGKRLALVLSRSGGLDIFVKNLTNGKLQQLTKGWSIDTEPAWAPDGKSIYFTSDRGGSPQIYQIELATGKVARVTFQGKYNARASISPDGSQLVTLYKGDSGTYAVAVHDLTNHTTQVLSSSDYTQSPSLAPNGKMVVYSKRNDDGQFLLAMVSTDGKVQLNLPMSDGDVREPAWSPFLG